MSMANYLTFPEFIFAHFRYQVWIANKQPYEMKEACDLFNRYQEQLRGCIMSAKKQAQQQSNNRFNSNIQFCNINLSAAEKKQFKSWFNEHQSEIPTYAAAMTAQGYKLSIKWDNEHECFIATITCTDESMTNGGKALSSRSSDWLEAIALNIFKTDVIAEDGVWESSQSGNNWG